jgi:hypothetical protein
MNESRRRGLANAALVAALDLRTDARFSRAVEALEPNVTLLDDRRASNGHGERDQQ